MKPTAAPAHFPYRHRTMAEVLRDEQRRREIHRIRTARQFGYEGVRG